MLDMAYTWIIAGASTPKAVTLSVSGGSLDNSTFNNNGNDGLVIFSKGAITISGLEAQGNNGNGATLKNDNPGAVGGITIIGWGSYFGNNTGGYGLTATSFGAITATNLWAWGNNSYGALLDNSSGTGAVSITGDTSYGNNGWYGLEIHSKGAITLGTIYTNNNNGTGVMLDNSYGTQNVTLNGANHDFNNNAGNGLEIFSHGTITITNLYANNNDLSGAVLDNCLQTAPGSGVCTTVTAKAVTLNGNNNTFEWNGGNGLDITSKGVITTNNVIARDNGGFGAYFDNQMTGAVGTINVKNVPTFWAEFARNGSGWSQTSQQWHHHSHGPGCL